MTMTRTNDEWLRTLRASGPEQVDALQDLRQYLLRAARYSLNRQAPQFVRQAPGETEQLAEDCAQDALIAVLKHLDEFRLESQFTTWAYKFAVNIALNAARHERQKGVSLDDLLDQELPVSIAVDHRAQMDPNFALLQGEVWEALREIVAQELTERQRQVFRAVMLDEVPLDEIARLWNSNRNAIYKILHDARRKLKAELQARGYTLDDFSETFRVKA